MVPVTSVSDAVAFFCDVLGFDCTFQEETYAFLRRDDAAILLLQADPGTDLAEEPRQLSCYIDVYAIDTLYAALKPELDKLAKSRVRAPFDQNYGQREFHVIYEALLIFFGEPIGES